MSSAAKRVLRWCIVIISLLCVCALPLSGALATTNFDSLKDQTEIKLIGSAMAQCVNQLYSNSYASGQTYNKDNVTDIFKNLPNTNSIKVGYAVEDLLDAGNDGKIWCNETNSGYGVAEVFARRIGAGDTMGIVCNGEAPGLMKLQYYDGSDWVNSSNCSTLPDGYGTGMGDTLYRYVLNDQAAANAYLNSIYPYDWSSAASRPLETDAEKYYAYLADFMVVCTNGDKIEASSSAEVNQNQYYSAAFYVFDPSTNTAKEYRYKIDQSMLTGTNFISGDSSCASLASKLRIASQHVYDETIRADAVQLEAERKKCNQDVQALVDARKEAANNIIERNTQSGLSNSALAQTALQQASDWLNRLNKFEQDHKDQYYTENNGEVTCLTVPVNGSGGTATPTTPPPSSSSEDTSNNGESFDEINADLNDADISACKKATSLGWVICPFMHLIGKAAMGLFDQLAGQWLMINSSEVETGSSLYNSWTTFRDYANIGFAILFAVVVFSQVTGIGLSNYSIKKMLPTLIMVAVLVNISFFICQIAVDLTNIVGVEIGNVLDDLGNSAMLEADGRTMGEQAGYALAGLFEAAGIVGLAASAPTIVAASIPSVGFAIVGAIAAGISALIGYFFLLILLALRKAILYVVIIASPLAFICYALPNTKSLFDKWKKLFMNLLLVFPICQILVSGGLAMSKIMMSNGNENSFFYQFTAMLLQIVPIFFIPMVLRSSMAMLGNIGARVSQMGAKLGGGLSNTAKNSQLAKRAATSLNAWGANKAANFKSLRRTPKSAFGRMLQANTRAKIATARTQAEDLRVADKVSQNMFDNDWYMDSVRATNDLKAQEDLADKYMNGVRNKTILDENGNAYDVNDLDVKVDGDDSSRDGSMVNMLIKAIQDKDEVRIKSVVKHLMSKGDKGFAAIGRALRKTGFGEDGRMLHQGDERRDGFNMAAKYLANNDKWNMLMKNWDAGTHEMVMNGAMDSDIATTVRDANGNSVMQEMAHFDISGAGKMSPSQTANAGDGVFNNARSMFNTADGMLASMANSSYAQSMQNMIDNMKAAYADDRIYSRMSGGSKRNMEKLYHDAQIYDQHKATVQAWINSQAKTRPVTEKEIREYVEKSFATIRSQVERNSSNLQTLEESRQSINIPRP